MALTTKTMSEEIKTDAGVPEGYEFVKDDEGRIALKKIRKVEEKKEEKVEIKTKKKVKK